MSESPSYFRNLHDGNDQFDNDAFLTEVGAQFHSENIVKEVRWRLAVLKEISAQPELVDVSDGLRDRLTQIFTTGGEEQEILGKLKDLTEIKSRDGKLVELRRFLKRGKRVLNEFEYRRILSRKIENTQFQIINLMAFFPDSKAALKGLTDQTKQLITAIKDQSKAITSIKSQEDSIRNSPAFEAYEEYKSKFLVDWLGQFSNMNAEELERMSPEEIQQLVVEHQRHQMTQLLKSKIIASDLDMSEHLGLHDTLEGNYAEEDFWTESNVRAKEGFRDLVLSIIRTFGILKGRRYAFFQSEEDKDTYVLFGVGIGELPEDDDAPIEMIPYIKPFTRKSGYLLEIRKRDLGDPDQYYYELRHYVLPFLFAFDNIQNFNVSKELISFFTSNY